MTQIKDTVKFKAMRVVCEFCNKEQSKGNLKRHQKTCPDAPENKKNPQNDYRKGKENHKLPNKTIGDSLPNNTVGTPLNQYNKPKLSQSVVNSVASASKYEMIDKAMGKCPHCEGVYHISGLPKHIQYCSKNGNAKNGYKTKRKWECRYCKAIFLHQKERDLHESRCENTVEANERDTFDRLRDLKRLFPEIYNKMNGEAIKLFLEGEI